MNENIADFIDAVKEEEEQQRHLKSNHFKYLLQKRLEGFYQDQQQILLVEIIGAAAPRINGIILTYKQNRFERNMMQLMKELTERIR